MKALEFNQLPTLLICDDNRDFHTLVKFSLKEKFQIQSAYNGDEALVFIKKNPITIILLDIQMRTDEEGLDYLPRIKDNCPETPIIVSSGKKDFETLKRAIQMGATDYVPKDFKTEELVLKIEAAIEKALVSKRIRQQTQEALTQQKKHALIGNSHAIQQLRKTIERMRKSQANVLITGETGTGKEVVARLLRELTPEMGLSPFVAVDSSTIQGSMAEAQLFGYEKGAFTGAERTTRGIFEEADGGIVYFDEIGNMPIEIQAKLLRVLQEKEITRIGSTKVIPLRFRVVAATNLDLEKAVQEGRFKDDLLQRLQVLPIHLPPLRERKEDIRPLVEHFSQLNWHHSTPPEFSPEFMDALINYDWPGNVRELNNILSYCFTMAEDSTLDPSELPPKIKWHRTKGEPGGKIPDTPYDSPSGVINFYDQVANFESRLLTEAFQEHSGNMSLLAKSLGMSRSHLYTKLKEYGISVPAAG